MSVKPMYQGGGANLAGSAASGNGVPGAPEAVSAARNGPFGGRYGSADAETSVSNRVPADNVGHSFSEALGRALRLLARREHGHLELRSKLVAKGFDEDVAAGVADKLRADGLQSDERFAAALVRRRVARGYGPLYIRGELRERRVDDEVADAELNRTDEFWFRIAVKALARKFSAEKFRAEQYNTRARFLARRGFPADIVYRALRSGTEHT